MTLNLVFLTILGTFDYTHPFCQPLLKQSVGVLEFHPIMTEDSQDFHFRVIEEASTTSLTMSTGHPVSPAVLKEEVLDTQAILLREEFLFMKDCMHDHQFYH